MTSDATAPTDTSDVRAFFTDQEPFAARIAELEARPRRWLVTGAAGFIGSHLVQALLGWGQTVVGLDDLSTGHRANVDDVVARVGPDAAARYRFTVGDVTDPVAVADAIRGVDVVLHHAAFVSVPGSIEDPRACHRTNVEGFLEVLEAARAEGVKRVVYAASSASYGDDDAPEKREEATGSPLSMYAATKTADEAYAAAYAATYGLQAVGLRYFNVFGPRQDPQGAYAAVIPAWIERLRTGAPCVVHGDGGQTRDFCHVANIVGANLLAATTPAERGWHRVYNVGTGVTTDLLELFALLRDAVAGQPGADPSTATAEPTFGPPRAGDVRHSRANVDRARGELGFRPIVDVRAGIENTVAWFLREDA
jgi:UDP-N-acetylglucosamine 4-epimerase